jgi:demethylmenaquinone methyltransferase/2-methoxy-6-polyprenyl-1,4-benzoquinol methylase
MIQKTISRNQAQKFYDSLGKRYSWFEFYEGRALEYGREALDLETGMKLLEVGVGTGKQHELLQGEVQPEGNAFGIDLSWKMLLITRERVSTPLCQADAQHLPFIDSYFDRLYTSYVLDLLPSRDLPAVLDGFFRVIKPGGRLVIVALTEGVNASSRALVTAWKFAYSISPITCGGCRPLQLAGLVSDANFRVLGRKVIVQFGVPSEIITAIKSRME